MEVMAQQVVIPQANQLNPMVAAGVNVLAVLN